jgi:hypothetical protein
MDSNHGQKANKMPLELSDIAKLRFCAACMQSTNEIDWIRFSAYASNNYVAIRPDIVRNGRDVCFVACPKCGTVKVKWTE